MAGCTDTETSLNGKSGNGRDRLKSVGDDNSMTQYRRDFE